VLTDDDLTRQLTEAFRADAGTLTYDRAAPRPRVRPAWARPGLVALPAAGAVAAAVLVAGSLDRPSAPSAPVTSAAPAPAPSRSPGTGDTGQGGTGQGGTVTDEIRLAGLTFTVERTAGDVAIADQFLRQYDPGELPAWAEPVELESGAAAEVWVGQDPATGSVSMFVRSPQRWGGALTGLASPTLTVEQMQSIARTGTMS
jgi:hypothetical protein